MPSNTFLIVLVILNLLTMHYAYRIDPNDELTQVLFRKYEIDGETGLADLYNNFKQVEDNNDLIPCHRKLSPILSSKLDDLSRRDTGFLRFGRKR